MNWNINEDWNDKENDQVVMFICVLCEFKGPELRLSVDGYSHTCDRCKNEQLVIYQYSDAVAND